MSSKHLVLLAVAAGFIGGLVWWGNVHQRDAKNPASINIGAILPLSGDFAGLGEAIQQGVTLGVAEAQKRGEHVSVVFEDDKSLSQTATASAAIKLTSVDKVDAALTMIIEEARPAMPIFNSAKIPFLILWDSNDAIRNAGDHVFSNGFSTERAGADMATYAYQKLDLRNIAVLAHDDAWANIIAPAFVGTFTHLGGSVVFDQKVGVETTDYKTLIAKIQATHPDGIYFPLIPPTSANFLTQAKQLGVTATLLTGDALTPDVIGQVRGAVEGAYLTNVYSPEADSLVAKYKEDFGAEPYDPVLLSFGYDGVMKVIEASKHPGATVSDKITSGFNAMYGLSKSADREEKIFRIANGVPQEVAQ